MRLLGIDYGQRRMGIAVSDPLQITVRPVTTIDRKKENTFEVIKEILETESPEKIIFGLPLDHNDEETEMCAKVRNFAKRLYSELDIELPFDFQDESFSSVRTHAIMQKTSTRKKRAQKGNIDKIAACVILEDYIRYSNGSILLY